MKPIPSGPVGSQTDDALQPQGTGAGLLPRKPPHHLKPHSKRVATAMEDRPGGHRNLMAATPAVHQVPSGDPGLARGAFGALEPLGPSQNRELLPAIRLRRKATVELPQGARVIQAGFPAGTFYPLWALEENASALDYQY